MTSSLDLVLYYPKNPKLTRKLTRQSLDFYWSRQDLFFYYNMKIETTIIFWLPMLRNSIPWWHHQWEHFRRYWSFVRGIHWSPVDSPRKGQGCNQEHCTESTTTACTVSMRSGYNNGDLHGAAQAVFTCKIFSFYWNILVSYHWSDDALLFYCYSSLEFWL